MLLTIISSAGKAKILRLKTVHCEEAFRSRNNDREKKRTVRIMPTLEGGKETAGGGGRRKAPGVWILGGDEPLGRAGGREEAFIVKRLRNKKQ